jgi:glycosyltransferase involved in cell wall biosynthesis
MKEGQFKILNNCIDPFLIKSNRKGKSESLLNKYGFSNDNKILLTLTRLSEKERPKGYDKVLRAVQEIAKKDNSIRYLFVGKYENEEKKRLDLLIEELGIADLVQFSGFVPDEEIESYFNLADLYVMPSKKEGFGIIFIEALYYGLPVIAGNKDGSVDALANGAFGLLVDPDDQNVITAAIEKVIADKTDYIPNHNLFMEWFSFDTYKRNFENILFT